MKLQEMERKTFKITHDFTPPTPFCKAHPVPKLFHMITFSILYIFADDILCMYSQYYLYEEIFFFYFMIAIIIIVSSIHTGQNVCRYFFFVLTFEHRFSRQNQQTSCFSFFQHYEKKNKNILKKFLIS